MSTRKLSTTKLSGQIFNPVVGGTTGVDALPVDILVVAGGGGASFSGGGAGGLTYKSGIFLRKSTDYTIIIGAGGISATTVSASLSASATPGGYSRFYATNSTDLFDIVVPGGGCGARNNPQLLYGRPSDGGSGGGGTGSTSSNYDYTQPGHGNAVPGFGYRGGGSTSGTTGVRATGGGGAGGTGGDGATVSAAGSGGVGMQYSISGTATYYAGGGGGGAYNGTTGACTGGNGGAGGGGAGSGYTSNGTAGVDGGGAATLRGAGGAGGTNTGGGGGGAWGISTTVYGGNGGSGIVIIRYPDTYTAATTSGSVTYTVSGGYRIYKYTGSGTFTI